MSLISLSVNDLGNTGSGGALSDAGIINIAVIDNSILLREDGLEIYSLDGQKFLTSLELSQRLEQERLKSQRLAEFIDDFPYLKSQVMRVLESAAKLLIAQERSA